MLVNKGILFTDLMSSNGCPCGGAGITGVDNDGIDGGKSQKADSDGVDTIELS